MLSDERCFWFIGLLKHRRNHNKLLKFKINYEAWTMGRDVDLFDLKLLPSNGRWLYINYYFITPFPPLPSPSAMVHDGSPNVCIVINCFNLGTGCFHTGTTLLRNWGLPATPTHFRYFTNPVGIVDFLFPFPFSTILPIFKEVYNSSGIIIILHFHSFFKILIIIFAEVRNVAHSLAIKKDTWAI